MSWKKHFKPVNSVLPVQSRTLDGSQGHASIAKYSNWLPEVYAGPPDRLQRYTIYDQMGVDHEISAALDTLSDFGTEPDEVTKMPFLIEYNDEPNPSEVQILEKSLSQWIRINKFKKRLWRIFRSTLVYGDQFFIRDPETFELYWIDPSKVEKVIVNESDGKKIESYFVKDVDLLTKNLVATNQLNKLSNEAFGSNGIVFAPPMQSSMNYVSGGYGSTGSSTYQDGGSTAVDAEHILQISLTEGMDQSWPFGGSILEKIFKVYKQKELLEDAILIYRIHRAPERRVFFIDVGTMPPNKSSQYLERIRYEVQQKRVPSRTGSGSNVVDSTYNPMCITLDTRIPLLDGRILALSDLITEYNSGKENWVYSTDAETGKVVPGNITWAGITRKNADIIKITLDNGKVLRCTPDHKIPVLGKGFVEAKDLTIHDPLISFETRKVSLSKDKDRSYEQVFDHKENQWVFTHRMVAKFFKNLEKHQEFTFSDDCIYDVKDTIHHADYDRYNNSPSNLQWMNRHDHILYHSFVKKEYWANLSTDESTRIKNKIRSGLAKYRLDNPDWKQIYETRDSSWINEMKENAPLKYTAWRQSLGESLSKFYKAGSVRALELTARATENLLRNKAKNQNLVFTQPMLTRLVELVKEHNTNRIDTINLVNNDTVFINLLKDANPILKNSTNNVKNDKFTNSKLERMYIKFGYKNWKDFKKNIEQYNHRITSIEVIVGVEDVGTITVDGKEKWHNYHTFAIESGIFIKNSILEDYFFAVTSEGRGSKVEVLPGGENLGDIDDLRYFNNKMLRALGVPSSYLPTGPEDGTAAVNDGRVGSAFIQEFRFSKVVSRFQELIIEPLDNEFKLFLKNRGVSIDNSLFNLTFTPPQSFSEYRQLELDAARINTFTALLEVPFISKRYILTTYLGWSQEQLVENERMWKEERSKLTKTFAPETGPGAAAGLSDVGITSSGIEGMSGGDQGMEDMSGENSSNDTDPNVDDTEVDNFGN
jgi:hypothetical protein